MRRRVFGVAVLPVVVLAAGCSPPAAQLVAVTKGADGAPYLVAVPCSGHRVDTYEVSVRHPDSDTSEPWRIERTWSDAPTETVALFSAPPGWDVADGQRALREGVTYSVTVRVVDEDDEDALTAVTGLLTFATDDFRALRQNQVLSGQGRDEDVQDYAEFRQDVLADC
jgi:hypothetical protein